jgi:hypothetical protein
VLEVSTPRDSAGSALVLSAGRPREKVIVCLLPSTNSSRMLNKNDTVGKEAGLAASWKAFQGGQQSTLKMLSECQSCG